MRTRKQPFYKSAAERANIEFIQDKNEINIDTNTMALISEWIERQGYDTKDSAQREAILSHWQNHQLNHGTFVLQATLAEALDEIIAFENEMEW